MSVSAEVEKEFISMKARSTPYFLRMYSVCDRVRVRLRVRV